MMRLMREEACGPQFGTGQLVRYREAGYRGVVVSVEFNAADRGLAEAVTLDRPGEPWYRVLIHQSSKVVYAPESCLALDKSREPVEHPDICIFFDQFSNGRYRFNRSG